MNDDNDASTSSNAVNQPWSVDRVYELVNSERRPELFVNALREKLPDDVQTGVMLSIAEKMAEMDNGNDSIWIYTGHPENANPKAREQRSVESSLNNPSVAVIERLGYPAYNYLDFPARQTIWAITELYRQSPACKSRHRNAPSEKLESYVKEIIEAYVISQS